MNGVIFCVRGYAWTGLGMTGQKYWALGSYRVSNWQMEYMGLKFIREMWIRQNFGIQF